MLINLGETVTKYLKEKKGSYWNFFGMHGYPKKEVIENTKGKRIWATRFAGELWGIWKERNAYIFRGKRMSPGVLVRRIREETELWLKCSKGVSNRGRCYGLMRAVE